MLAMSSGASRASGRAEQARNSLRLTQARGSARSLFYQWTFAFSDRTEGLIAGDRRKYLVVVPGIFGFGRRLDLNQKHVVNHAPILANDPSPREEIVDRHFTHLGEHRLAVGSSHGLDGFQVMRHGRVNSCMSHGWHRFAPLEEPLRPRPRIVIEVPIEPLDESQALRNRQTHAVNVRDINE